MEAIEKWRARAKRLKTETLALYLAYRDPRVPWHARLFAALVVGYAFSPIDLIPDFIPVLGYLDDLVLIPLGVALALRMIPPPVMEEARKNAQQIVAEGRPINRVAAAVIVCIWLALLAGAVVIVLRVLGAS